MAKRIVFHIASLRGGGAERVFVLMANELASRGHDVTLFTWNAEGPNAALRSPAVHLVDFDLPIRGEGYGKWATLKGIVRSARLFSRLGPHAVYSAPEFANLIVALALLLARSRARFFPSFHAAASLPSSSLGARIAVRLSALVAARATKAIAVSVGVGRDIAARGFSQSKVVVINNPLPPAAALQQDSYAWQAKLATMGDGPVIATAGRLVPVKDHRTLLRAFAILRAGRRVRLVIFGEGPLAAELRAYVQEPGIGADVLFAGYVNDPAACYAAADLFVLSSTSEGFGNVLVEAMAAGVPVVSTDAPHGPREILGDGRFGALVPVGDAAALAKAMADMLDHPTSVALLKSRAADFEVEKIGDLYEALL
ncbi:glycosyltransferase [Mesorhizobium sp.]|uniref:glycosyltransferase n=1 Tax=Mesorhizobium sp. TaxID=1871066 RepID=UPI000FE4CB7F|nr:glycosyltransferase [Mesorhizobium sp.]RWB31866.1 MAG: glycosyltransferase [Mesorhizobium sp.]RWD48375.1 MAG: glycosyltransferase [Mesorhizobium sp.]